ncbi:MAG: hypothetical protein BroJett024_18250 [Alphaproteobacteria bacterium]|nr:MAG: hypothetical protein BroJett024_18250 [Alphaproteobacteria bacterium]
MSDQRFISADAAPRLTSHLRALSLIAPLQRAEDNKGMLHVSAKTAERVDMRYLALAAIELLIDRMGAGGTAGRAELIEYLADLARLQSRNLSDPDATALAEHVFDGLTNARDRRARFKVRLFDPDQPEGVFFEFALLRAEPLPDGTVGYPVQDALDSDEIMSPSATLSEIRDRLTKLCQALESQDRTGDAAAARWRKGWQYIRALPEIVEDARRTARSHLHGLVGLVLNHLFEAGFVAVDERQDGNHLYVATPRFRMMLAEHASVPLLDLARGASEARENAHA